MRFHWQNLNDKPFGKMGNPLMHLRFWWGALAVEWLTFSGSFRISFEVGGDDKWCIGFACGLFSIWIHWSGYSPQEREFKLYFYEKALWLQIWGSPWKSNSNDPWIQKMHVFHFDDFFLGRAKYWSEDVETRATFVPMPEGSYPATVKMFYSNWKRPRWFRITLLRAEVTIEHGIPHEGKGENSWDCGEDATYVLTCQANNVEEAVAKVVESVLRSRKRYGTPERIKNQMVLATA